MLKEYKVRDRGFTLIELLIVIVIIGILAGVLISVIDPAAQQNRARNATTEATINKMALGISGFRSSFGRIPAEGEFNTETFIGYAANGTNCNSTTAADCTFSIGNAPLPATCAANGWNGDVTSGGSQCFFYYCGGGGTSLSTCAAITSGSPAVNTTHYRLFAKTFGSANVLMYDSETSAMYLCNSAATTCTKN